MAGGAGSRLGADKATLCRADGTPLLSHIARTLALVAAEVIVVAGSPPHRADLEALLQPAVSARWLSDDPAFPACGPLGGLYSGLGAARYELVLAVGCDMPFLAPALLRELVERAVQGQSDIVAPVVAGHPQPLHALYRRTPCRARAEQRLRAGHLSLRGLCADPALRVTFLDEAEALALDPSGRSWLGVNTSDEMAVASLRFRDGR